MKQDINRFEILNTITPLIENTAMRFGYIPIEKRVPLDSTIKETEGQWHMWLSSKGVFYEQRNYIHGYDGHGVQYAHTWRPHAR